MTLFDTTELRRPTQRKLHAAWQEIVGEKVCITGTTASELAPMAAAPTSGPNGLSAAEDELGRLGGRLSEQRRSQLLRQAWWATMWRSADAPFRLVELEDTQTELCNRILERIDRRCFPGTDPDEYFEVGDPRIVCEAIATGSKMLLTSDMRMIDRIEVNRWAVDNAGHFGLEPGPVVFDADAMLVRWSDSAAGHQLLLQAALLATWPEDDNAPALEVVKRTQGHIAAMAAGEGGKLQYTAGRICNGLTYHHNPEGLVESTRQLLPSATVETDRLHPSHPSWAPQGPQPLREYKRSQTNTPGPQR